MSGILKRFWKDQSGAYAIMMGIATIPLLLGVGTAVDYGRLVRARSHIQQLADGTALALAASRLQTRSELEKMASNYVAANREANVVENVEIASLQGTAERISLQLSSTVPTYFMSLASIRTMSVGGTAVADRAINGAVELSLVLDNTFSMSDKDSNGKEKLATLKLAAKNLVNELTSNPEARVSVALVPYAENVNVGAQNRTQPWMDVDADKQTGSAQTCEMKTKKTQCDTYPKYACEKEVDGVKKQSTCGGGNIPGSCKEVDSAPYKSCTGGYTNYTWYGCVVSRKNNAVRLDDSNPNIPYPGYVDTSRKCPTPIIPLTPQSGKSAVIAGIDGMAFKSGSYEPKTYIPAGLIWGLNTLSPPAPFTEGAAYDSKNQKPRKALVLMTDGENTMRIDTKTGKAVNVELDGDGKITAKGKTQVAATNAETLAICKNIKGNNIELYTIAFAVDDDDAKQMLQDCASGADHYYDASDSTKLLEAFGGIAKSLSVVRLVQ